MRHSYPSLTKFAYCLAILTFLLTLAADEAMGRAVRFAVLGDRTGGHQPGVYGEVVEEIARLRPDFVLTVGDQIEGYVDDSIRIHGEWQEYNSLVKPLTMPVHYTPGNHDIWSDMSEEIYRHYFGDPYYSFDEQGIHFIILDNSRWDAAGQMPQEQLDWLIADLTANWNVPYKMLFCHKPIWYESVAQGMPDTLHALMVNFEVDAVFTGHYHEYFAGEYDGVMYTSVGSSGAAAGPNAVGMLYHYLWVTVDDHGIHVSPIKKGGVLPWEQVTADDKMMCDRLRHVGLSITNPLRVNKDLRVQQTSVTVAVDNRTGLQAIRDTLKWEIPDGWVVEPSSRAILVDSGGTATMTFTTRCSASFSPTPQASLTLYAAKGIPVEALCPIPVARQATALPVREAPVIDGEVSEKCWHSSVSELLGSDGKAANIDPTRFYFCYDQDNLYLAAYCEESRIDSIFDSVKERDGAVYAGDCVGYFLEPVRGSDTAYQIYFSPQGVVFDQQLIMGWDGYMDSDRGWNGDYEIKSTRGDDYWSIEARIPLAQFNTIAAQDQEWRINFRRKQRRLNSAGDWQPIDYNPQTYGLLLFR